MFVYLFICKATTIKVNIHFYKQCSQPETRLICERAVLFAHVLFANLQNASIVF